LRAHLVARAVHGQAQDIQPRPHVADAARREGGDRPGRPHAPASLRMSFSTPAAVTSAPAPGPVITSGLALYRAVVNTSWLSDPLIAASGLVLGTARSPTAILAGVTVAT